MSNSHLPAAQNRIWQWLTKPVLAQMLNAPVLCRWIIVVTVAHLTASYMGWHIFRCPLMETCHLPCPGCGLTRACKLWLTGDFLTSAKLHAFAPIAIFALAFIFAASILPLAWRKALAQRIEAWEAKTGISQSVFLLLWIYWLVRLLFFPAQVELLRSFS